MQRGCAEVARQRARARLGSVAWALGWMRWGEVGWGWDVWHACSEPRLPTPRRSSTPCWPPARPAARLPRLRRRRADTRSPRVTIGGPARARARRAQYIDDSMMSTGALASACIVGFDGQIYAQSADFPAITAAQVQTFKANIANPDALGATGLMVGDNKFYTVACDPGSVLRGRKGASGICIAMAKTCFLIGIYGEGQQAGDVNNIVESLCDYLKVRVLV